jgi:hypothetical protein
MAKIPTFANQDPVIESLPLNPEGQGGTKISDILGSVSSSIIKDALSAKKTVSNAALFSQNSMLTNEKNNALTQIQLNPSNQDSVVNNFRKTVDLMNSNVSLSKEDNEKFTTMSSSAVNEVTNKGLLAAGKQIRIQESMNFRRSFPNTVNSIISNLQSNPKAAQAEIESTDKLIADGLINGFVTPSEAANSKKVIDSVLSKHERLLNFVKGGASPIDGLHALTNIHGESNENLPTQAGTFFHYSLLNQNVSYEDAIAELHRGKVDAGVISSLSPKDFNRYLLSAEGIDNAQATINSGNHYSFVQKAFDSLDQKKASELSTSEKATRDQLSFFIKNINNKKMLDALEKTSHGASIFGQYNDSINAIKSNGAISDQEKQNQFSDEFSKFTNSMVSYAQSLGIPSDKINPIPDSLAENLNSSYNEQVDPSKVLSFFDKYTNKNAVYLANSMKDTMQQESLLIANNLKGKKEDGFSKDLILATSKKADFSDIKFQEGVSNNTIKQAIMSENNDLFSYIGSQPNGQKRVSDILKASVRYVKLLSQKNNDLGGENISDYENSFNESFSKSIALDTGTNFSINNDNIPTTHSQNKALADYLIEEVKQQIVKNSSSSHANKLFDLSPVKLIDTPDGNLMVMNSKDFQIGKKFLYTSELMAKAEGWENKINDKLLTDQEKSSLWDEYHPLIPIEPKDLFHQVKKE